MQIGVEAQSANTSVRTGTGEYAFRLLEAMKSLTSSTDDVLLYTSEPLQKTWTSLPASWKSRVLAWRLPGWARLRLNVELLMQKPDVVFFPASMVALFAPSRRSRKRTVATIHDVGFLRIPALYHPSDRRRQERALRRAIKKSTTILTVSEFTKRELVELSQVAEDRIVVTPLGIDRTRFQPASSEAIQAVRRKFHLSQHYLLFVSRLDEKKNLETLLEAFAFFKRERGVGDPHELVLVGPDGYGAMRIRRQAETIEGVHVLGAVSEEEKMALYSGALGLVNLSWYEGFGLTPLEAASCGTPSLLSDIPAHREVMGDGAMYISPKASSRVALALKVFVEEVTQREALLAKAQQRLDVFSWEETARKTLEVLRGASADEHLFDPRV